MIKLNMEVDLAHFRLDVCKTGLAEPSLPSRHPIECLQDRPPSTFWV